MTRSIDLPGIYIPFIFGLFFWITNGSLSAYALVHRKVSEPFAFVTLVIGGIGLHLLIIVLRVIWQRIHIKSRGWYKVARISSSVTLSAVVTVVPFSIAIFAKSFEDPSIAPAVKFSLDKNHPNLVEVFSDGFDLSHFDDYKYYDNDSNFNEFKWFTHFATVGHPTHLSLSTILNDFEESNPFRAMYDNNLELDESTFRLYEYSGGSLKNGAKHLSVNKDEFNARTIINPAGFSSLTEYGASISGVPKAIKKIDPTLNVTNWVGARDANATKGFNSNPIDIQGYKWLANNSQISQGKGARVFIGDMITHHPFAVDDNQQFTVWGTKRESVTKSLRKSFDDIITSLKNIKDASGFSAFDNSMILIYGDHASHDFIDYQTKDTVTRGCESSFIIKYPKQSDGSQQNQKMMEHIGNKYIWSPQIGDIIKNYFSPTTIKDDINYFNNYFNNNPNPNKFNNILRPVFNSPFAYGMAHWTQNNNGEWEYNIEDKSKPLTVLSTDRNEQKLQVDDLARVVY